MRQIIVASLLLVAILGIVETVGQTYQYSGSRVQNFTQSTITTHETLAQR
ncbi:hypothetical protein SAMN05421543_12320 [Alicyclobacillus macrosporangiidus]|uniref:Uncharacterized protein n=1 Tax=Alicyclobacillus macrosporangiidus TaxID=392015 RepID=A0A1I7L1R4_9BACL|nr:hypothetical protein SAMN05421543_12320 [Alicyclobacillus macrosporangiidus]